MWLIGGGLVVVIIVAGVVTLLSSLDSLIKTAVETVGTEVAGVTVSLDKASVSASSGSGSLSGLNVGNPPGFKTDQAFSLGQVSITLDTSTVTSDPVVIKEVIIARPEITYEIGNSGTNLDTIQSNVSVYSAGQSSGGEAESGGEGPNFIIENLYLRGGQVNVMASQFLDNTMSAPLPDIHLTDIGKAEGGATPGEIAQQVMDQVLADISGAVSQIDISGITKNLGDSAKKALESVDTKAIQEGAGSLGESTGGAVEGASDAVKKLLGSGD